MKWVDKCPDCGSTDIFDADCEECSGSCLSNTSDDDCEECEGSGFQDFVRECGHCGLQHGEDEFQHEEEG